MFDLLIRGGLLAGRRVDVGIRGGRFAAVEPAGSLARAEAAEVWAGEGYLLRPPFYNLHTHQAMTLLRGIDDDCRLMDWLERCIWPREAHLDAELVYAGARLAILEGIRSGCVAFNDMYCHQTAVVRAACDMGVRARIGVVWQATVSEHFENAALLALRATLPARVGLSIAPHAIYTTTPEQLRAAARQALDLGLPVHIHAAESLTEHRVARERWGAESPIVYLAACGIFEPRAMVAHACHLSPRDREILAAHDVTLIHCPQSNAKLASGDFDWPAAARAGLAVTLGTDGAASNNSLSMLAEAKAAALTAKRVAGDPAALPFAALDRALTETAAAALGFPEAGRIAPGAEADLLMVSLAHPAFIGTGSADANFIYAADPSAIDSVLCGGRVLMRHRVVAHEAEILAAARAAVATLEARVAGHPASQPA